ncbi:FAD-binding oxidoreductase [Patulibacter minatonensis]|uniref:FAD-binding oxidoreductase n=1 Tax=Patulibacter minatonensis TaxID=298163 RepID=UPI00056462B5|nr:FAD-binding oxidoreductase [Patulibacter minatonensis]
MSTITAPPTTLDLGAALRECCTGPVSCPGDPGHDEARQAWNLSVDQRPEAVVRARSTADVVATVELCRARGLRVAPQATGHGAAALGPLTGAVLLRTDLMRDVAVDPQARTVRVAAGARWDDVLAASAPHGLAPLAGSAGDVGVVGFCLGGGLSFLGRRHGLACGDVLGADVVLADGSLVHARADDHAELLWALRGGSGAFGVVVALELALHPVPELSAGALFWPIERAREVLGAWRDWCAVAPESISTSARLMRFPPDPALPEPLRGAALVVVDGAFVGPAADAEAVVAPLRAICPMLDTFGPAPLEALTQLHMDPPVPVPAISTHALLSEADDHVLDALVATAGADSGTSATVVELRQLGGALARPTGVGAQRTIDAGFLFFALGVLGGPADPATIGTDLTAIAARVASRAVGTFPNFVESPDGDVAPESSVGDRLSDIKTRLDPAGVVQAAHAPRR